MTSYDTECRALREKILRWAMAHNAGHIASSMSIVEILVALDHVAQPYDELVISKGHGAYGVICQYEHYHEGECLERHPGASLVSTGSLGHGFPFAVGLAYAWRTTERHVWCIVGDAEMEEGSCWEAYGLWRDLGKLPITVIVDGNTFGARKAAVRAPLLDVDVVAAGHDPLDLVHSLKQKPHVLYCCTTKGKGVPFMEGKPGWHYRLPTTPEELSWIDSFLSSNETPPASS